MTAQNVTQIRVNNRTVGIVGLETVLQEMAPDLADRSNEDSTSGILGIKIRGSREAVIFKIDNVAHRQRAEGNVINVKRKRRCGLEALPAHTSQ